MVGHTPTRSPTPHPPTPRATCPQEESGRLLRISMAPRNVSFSTGASRMALRRITAPTASGVYLVPPSLGTQVLQLVCGQPVPVWIPLKKSEVSLEDRILEVGRDTPEAISGCCFGSSLGSIDGPAQRHPNGLHKGFTRDAEGAIEDSKLRVRGDDQEGQSYPRPNRQGDPRWMNDVGGGGHKCQGAEPTDPTYPVALKKGEKGERAGETYPQDRPTSKATWIIEQHNTETEQRESGWWVH